MKAALYTRYSDHEQRETVLRAANRAAIRYYGLIGKLQRGVLTVSEFIRAAQKIS